MPSPSLPSKKRILYIRHRRTYEISDGLRLNQDEWVETMSMLANVTIVDTDFDLDEWCSRQRPDFIVYESPMNFPAPLKISNPKSHSEIPRFGLQIQDPYSAVRVNYLTNLDLLGSQCMFTHMADMSFRLSPELKYATYSLPHLFDEEIFRDYELEKDIPVSIFGAHLVPDMYNWRAQAVEELPAFIPTLVYTHPGYLAPIPRHKFQVSGQDYARLLNRSYFSLADTTRFDCFLRKHLEIPACGSILVAPDTSALKPYGFKDMVNCILGTGQELYNKIGAVADDPQLYQSIRQRGFEMVHQRFSRKHWRGILDFFDCFQVLKPGETIVQDKLLGTFSIVPCPIADEPTLKVIEQYPDNETSVLMKLWINNIITGEGLDAIAARTKELSGWLSHVSEQFIPAGIACLLTGKTSEALTFFSLPQANRLKESGFEDYDPEEIAWMSFAAALTGQKEILALTRLASATMQHLSLRRFQWIARVIASGGNATAPPENITKNDANDRPSIHWTGQLPLNSWLNLIIRILDAHGQKGSELIRL